MCINVLLSNRKLVYLVILSLITTRMILTVWTGLREIEWGRGWGCVYVKIIRTI